jgi:phosphatidylserine/phosphatidylglycerophosphate/cardiolipin synthase-like enzyme
MKLIVQPDDGVRPLLRAVRRATQTVDAVIFRLDLDELASALEDAVGRGVTVRALIAHTNRGGKKELRKLERRLLDAGATVARTDDDLVRYHGKLLLVDAKRLFVMGFNYTRLDVLESRSFAVVTRNRKLVREAARLIAADASHKDFTPSPRGLVVSPENARQRLAAFIRKARRELLIYVIDSRPVHGQQKRVCFARDLTRCASPRVPLRFTCEPLQLLLAARVAEYHFMSCTREERPELAPHQPGT